MGFFLIAGRSLKGRSMFTFVAEDITRIAELETRVSSLSDRLSSQSVFFAKMVHELRTPLSGVRHHRPLHRFSP
jgi:signal transduction histidine kinase